MGPSTMILSYSLYYSKTNTMSRAIYRNESGVIVVVEAVEVPISVVQLNAAIAQYQAAIVELEAKIAAIQADIDLINTL